MAIGYSSLLSNLECQISALFELVITTMFLMSQHQICFLSWSEHLLWVILTSAPFSWPFLASQSIFSILHPSLASPLPMPAVNTGLDGAIVLWTLGQRRRGRCEQQHSRAFVHSPGLCHNRQWPTCQFMR